MEATAGEVQAAGGQGIPVVCDHGDDAAVAAVAERITAEQGRLDLLINNVWAGYERLNAGAWEEWNAPLWQQPLELFDAMFTHGVRAHYVATSLCAPLLMKTPGSLVVTVSFAVPEGEQHAYGMAKAADDRLAGCGRRRAAAPARRHLGGPAPRAGAHRGVMRFAEHLDLSASQSPEGVGRAVVALTADNERQALTGQALGVAALADRYRIDVHS